MLYEIGDVFLPLLIHVLLSNITALVLGGCLDSAWLTTVAAVAALPFFAGMYRRDQMKAPPEKKQVPIWVYLLMTVGGIVLNFLMSKGMEYFSVTERFSNAVQEELLGSGILVQIVGLGILVPVMEEFLFRGLLYQRLKKYLPTWMAILAGAAIFACYHGNMVQMIFAFPMALAMLLAYEKWKSLCVPVIFHIAVNLSTVCLSMFLPG